MMLQWSDSASYIRFALRSGCPSGFFPLRLEDRRLEVAYDVERALGHDHGLRAELRAHPPRKVAAGGDIHAAARLHRPRRELELAERPGLARELHRTRQAIEAGAAPPYAVARGRLDG